MARILRSQPAYILGTRSRSGDAPLHTLIRSIADALREEFGTVLILELWTDERLRAGETAEAPLTYQVRIHMPDDYQNERMSRLLYHDLSRIRINDAPIHVTYARRDQRRGPRGLPDLYSKENGTLPTGLVSVGLALSPAFRDGTDTTLRPIVLQRLRRQLAFAVQRLYYHFTRTYTTLNPAHHFSLGKRAFSRAARSVDERLAAVAGSFDLIMTATPVNVDASWTAFRRSGYAVSPRFLYRPIEVDPDALKRELWNIPVNRVDDPSMEQLFLDKRDELDIQISMLLERNTPRFLYNSLRLYGPVTAELAATARTIIGSSRRKHARGGRANPGGVGPAGAKPAPVRYLSAAAFTALAEQEVNRFRRILAETGKKAAGGNDPASASPMAGLSVQIRAGISGLLTVHGSLLVSRGYRIPEHRAEALIQHEIGTHILTFVNGSAQPITLLGTGLDGYESLQEGLAVTAEYLSGGMDRTRLRLLAARVLAALSVQDGADFIETYRLLTGTIGLSPRAAFLVAMRVHRGGGFVKDLIYLQGLVEILAYLKDDGGAGNAGGGGSLELLWTGKVALRHIRLLEELRYRKILQPAQLVPSYTQSTEYDERRAMLRSGITVFDLIAPES